MRLDCRPVGLGHSPSASAIGGLEQPSSAAVNTAQRPAHRLNCLGQPERSLPACRRGARGGLARCALRRRHHRIHRRPASMATQASANWPRAQSWPPTARGDVALARGGPLGSRGRAGRLPPPPAAAWIWDLVPRPKKPTPPRLAIQVCSSTMHSCDDLGESWRACRGCARSRRSAPSPRTPARGSPPPASRSYTP